MSNLQKRQDLLKDCLQYIKNLEDLFIESSSDFFMKDLKKLLDKKETKAVPSAQKPSNFNIQNAIDTTISDKQTKKEGQVKPLIKKESFRSVEKKPFLIVKQSHQKPFLMHESKKNIEIVKDKTDKKIIENKTIIRDLKPKLFDDDLSDIKRTIQKIFPALEIVASLDDKIAKQKSQKYKLKNIAAPITILAYKENEKHYRFLEKIAIALDVYFHPTKLISAYLLEKENRWNDFLLDNDIMLMIASDYTIFELPNLKTCYKENPSKGEKFLKNRALFLLPDISLYFKEPSLKVSLFKALELKIQNVENSQNVR